MPGCEIGIVGVARSRGWNGDEMTREVTEVWYQASQDQQSGKKDEGEQMLRY